MDELAEIAASVAQALGLTHSAFDWWMQFEEVADAGVGGAGYEHRLFTDGSNVFADPWRWMCLEWLLARGYFTYLDADGARYHTHDGSQEHLLVVCPASEIAARAIHAIISPAATPPRPEA